MALALGESPHLVLSPDATASGRFVPLSDRSTFVINTIQTVSVTDTAAVLEGTCFAIRR